MSKTACILANAKPPSERLLRASLQNFPFLIAVDGGANFCASLEIQPSLIVGDLDSLSDSARAKFSASTEILSHPTDKDNTDLRLALDEAVKRGFDDLLVLGWSDERLDYSLSALLDFARIDARITAPLDSVEVLFLNGHRNRLLVEPGKNLSIIGLSEGLHGAEPLNLHSKGLRWELHWQSTPKLQISQSNRAGPEGAEIHCHQGCALVLIAP